MEEDKEDKAPKHFAKLDLKIVVPDDMSKRVEEMRSTMDNIDDVMKKSVINIDLHTLQQSLIDCNGYLGYIGKLVEEATFIYSTAKGLASLKLVEGYPKFFTLKDTEKRLIFDAMLAKYEALYYRAKSTEKSLKTHIEAIVTNLSAEKEVYKKNV